MLYDNKHMDVDILHIDLPREESKGNRGLIMKERFHFNYYIDLISVVIVGRCTTFIAVCFF